jgi:CSLREA domain-containing protein
MKTHSLSKITLIICALFIFGSAFATTSHAATYVVNSTGDTNVCDNTSCTLRGAINAANTNSGADTITFSVTGTILLGSALPALADDVTISGPGANALTVTRDPAAAAFRIFTINSGKTVTISGLKITNGNPGGPPALGGGIYNDHATLTLSNCTISGNSAVGTSGFGGGIYSDGSSGSAMLTINDCTLNGNTASSGGGGIYNTAATANSGSATLTISNSTLSGNSAAHGGGIDNGGWPHVANAPLTLNNCTLSGNSATLGPAFGGGINNAAATVDIGSTILNAGASGDNFHNSAGGAVTSHGYNLSSDAGVTNDPFDPGTGGLNAIGDQTNANPMLGPLAFYGGPTATHILLTGSPAIDKGKNFSGATTDQRGVGFARTIGSAAVSGGDGTDIGAFERQASDIDPTLVVTTTADTNTNNTCSAANPCSLRDAITAADTSAPDDVIYFAVTGTIQLETVLPGLSGNTKILGPGANALTVKRDPSAAAAFRIFTINSGKTVTLSGLTIANGSVAGSFPNFNGGGILNDHATLTVSNCTVSGNSATNAAGGILNDGSLSGSAVLTVNNSTISGNSAPQNSGGILNEGFSGSASLTINNSTVSGNTGNGFGGGINNDGDTGGNAALIIHNSTISGNSATTGGGIFNQNGDGGTATVTIGGTILKTGASGTNISSPPGGVTSLGYNLSSDNETAFLNQTGDQNSTDPMLGPLQDNGGATFTHAPSPGSSAIDKGKNFTSFTTDQRGPGFSRIIGTAAVAGGDGSDIGSFEVQAPSNTPPTITAASGVTRQQGAASSNSQIATVSDNEDAPTALIVTVNGGTSATVNGVTVSNIAIDNSGNVTADVVASCSATNASFTLRVTDTGGLYSEATLNVSVTASNPPVITLKPAAVLQPMVNHSYHTYTISQMVQSATDDCDGNVISSVVIEKATSDEVENSPGPGDGNTLNDIVIASDCKSVQLRAERDGTMDGRVYLVTLGVSDTSGNVTTAVYKVSVPVGKRPAINSGVHYTVLSNCQL